MKIYYSKMNVTPPDLVMKELDILKKIGTVEMHLGGTYSSKKLLDSDIIVVTSYNGWKKGKGVISEINTASMHNISAYMFIKDQGETVPDFLRIKSTKILNKDWTLNYGTVELENSVMHEKDLKEFLPDKTKIIGKEEVGSISKKEYMAKRKIKNNPKEEDAWTELLKE